VKFFPKTGICAFVGIKGELAGLEKIEIDWILIDFYPKMGIWF